MSVSGSIINGGGREGGKRSYRPVKHVKRRRSPDDILRNTVIGTMLAIAAIAGYSIGVMQASERCVEVQRQLEVTK